MANLKAELKQKILESLAELDFLRNHGRICDFQVATHLREIDDEDLKEDKKFNQLLYVSDIDESIKKRPRLESPVKKDDTKTEQITNNDPPPKEVVKDIVQPNAGKVQHLNQTKTQSSKPQSPKPETPTLQTPTPSPTPEPQPVVPPKPKAQPPTPVLSAPIPIARVKEVPTTPKPPPTQSIPSIAPPSSSQTLNHDTPKPQPSPLRSQASTEKSNQRITGTIPSTEDSPTRISRAVDTIVKPPVSHAENNLKQHERVQHESAVQSRIAELRKQGLWSAKRLPKCQEPPRPKTHWDHLLEEGRWLCTDYKMERRSKRQSARKLAYECCKHVNNKRTQEERIQKEKLQYTRKVAASLSKDIRHFWSEIESIVDFRQQAKLEETRKKAYGLHLNYILDQTTKFSNTILDEQPQPAQQLANNQNETNYLINKDGDGDTDKKEPVINEEEQTKYDQKVEDIAANAESLQPKGNTFETATVNTKVPFLLKHSLREYQHIGLDWLVAMYKKQLNGILADEMGLGKTIQTIALLAYLACEEQDWGPHLIVVPTSVMLNWEMEFKKWCPAFKILTYYGTPKERKMKRVGWSRPNSFHVCITSYRLVIQDHAAFRRKQWCYLILDEAHYIKNFKSQRWQMLLNFNSQRRLLLTGTPLQNDLMELWSLMHFLMPTFFDSLREFKDWFVNPLTGMIEGSHEYNQELVQRLHKVLRPFLLRRLKVDVEKQLPKKKEIIKYCRLSKRQRYLYEEFMSLSDTKKTLASGNFLSVINVLMQLRKVCNHPNLFEPRPTIEPYRFTSLVYKVPGLLNSALDYDPEAYVNLASIQLSMVDSGTSFTSSARDYIRQMRVPRSKMVEEIDIDVSEASSTTQDDVMEVDEATDAFESDKVLEAYSVVKQRQREERRLRLQFMADINDIRCDKLHSIYYSDLKDILNLNCIDKIVKSNEFNIFSNGNGRLISSLVATLRHDPRLRLDHLSDLLDKSVRSPEQLIVSMTNIIDRFIFCVPTVVARPISLHVAHHSSKRKVEELLVQRTIHSELSPKMNFLNKIISKTRMSFPELRLIEYDCGKLQALGQLLIDLKSNDHRVLIFTQMSRMLDILEQFLNYHGHTYLRLDGATKIDQRQILMERFNNDKRIFCFILSTRSGGIGVNLVGADTVIFYDSDWNPTMDAQAQDRCHRIGQTRDVCIYRLICEDTIEQNIYRKAQQKRMLGDMAIEEGNFGNSCFKKNSIHELFERNKETHEADTIVEVTDDKKEMTKAEIEKLELALSKCEAAAGEEMDVDAIKVARADVDTDLKEFDENIPLTDENSPVVEKSEKEQQIDQLVSQMKPVQQFAIKYLECIHQDDFREELEQAEKEYNQELENKKSQWEQSRIDLLKEQAIMNGAKEEDSKTMLTYPKGAKCEHVQFMLDGQRRVEEMPLWAPPTPPTSPPSPVEEDNQVRYQPSMTPAMAARINAMGGLSSIFGNSEFNKTDNRYFIHEKDVYVDHSAHFIYEPNIMPESQLPPVNQAYTESETTSYTIGSKKIRLTGTPVAPGGYFNGPAQASHLQHHLQNLTNVTSTPDGSAVVAGQQASRKPKVRRDEVICLPKSLFDRSQGNHIKARRDLKLQKLRCVTRGNDSDPFAMQKFYHSFSFNPLGQSVPQDTIVQQVQRQLPQYPSIIHHYHQEQLPPWTIQEEWAVLMVIQHLQDLPVNLNILTPGHTPNWELVSEVVSDIGLAHRSFKMCEYHFARELQRREMTRDSSWEERFMQSSQANDSSQPLTKKAKKHKGQQPSGDGSSSQPPPVTTNNKSSQAQVAPFKPSKTGDMLTHDRSLQLFFRERYGIIEKLRQNRPKPLRSRFAPAHDRIPNNFVPLVREDKRMIDYDHPPKPEQIIMDLAEERKRRAIASRQAACSCCRPASISAVAPATSLPNQ